MMLRTLDEVIQYCEKEAEKQETIAKSNIMEIDKTEDDGVLRLYDADEYESCMKCASEHRQIAEWLKELKDYRERMPSYEAGYNDAKREIASSGEYERAYQRGFDDAIKYCTNRLNDFINAWR